MASSFSSWLKTDLLAAVTTLNLADYGYLLPAPLFLMLFLALKSVRLLLLIFGYSLLAKRASA